MRERERPLHVQVVATTEGPNGHEAILINETNRTQTAQVEIASLRECAFDAARASRSHDIDAAVRRCFTKRSICPTAALRRLHPYRRATCREDEVIAFDATSRCMAAKRLRVPCSLKRLIRLKNNGARQHSCDIRWYSYDTIVF
jgi:hypothetical protein